MDAEVITACGISIFGIDRHVDIICQFVFIQNAWIRQTECTRFHCGNNVVVSAGFELRTAGFDIQRSSTAKVFCGLKDFALLSVVKGNLFHILQRELSQIHCAVLGIANFYAIIENAQMMCAHRTDVNGFQAAHTAIIFDLHTGKVTQGICHAVRAQAFQFGTFQPLHRHYRLIG